MSAVRNFGLFVTLVAVIFVVEIEANLVEIYDNFEVSSDSSGNIIPYTLIQSNNNVAPVLYSDEAVKGTKYTIIMFDPDAPTPSNPTSRNWLHWGVENVDGKYLDGRSRLDVEEFAGNTFMKYSDPTPPAGSGLHRYVTMMFQQNTMLPSIHIAQRARFNLDHFVESYKLNLIAQTVFRTKMN